jgi:NAD(P)-dependent dehydrogenase (short-subunit alcohol dehydrogenase family)
MTHLDFGLTGKTVLVTGGAGGIGSAVCEGFAEAGARVAVVDIQAASASSVAAALGTQHRGFGVDLRQVAGLAPLVAEIEHEMAAVDVLINIAGIIQRTDNLFDVTEENWDAQHDINLKALFFLSQAVGKRLVETGRPGCIVNYSSQGWMSGGFGGSVVYNATKGAVTTMTRGMARSWAPHKIRVNAVAPGLVETPMLVDDNTTQSQIDSLCDSIPMKRLGQPDDHVGATVFLASDMARYMTGATINVSGGFLMY